MKPKKQKNDKSFKEGKRVHESGHNILQVSLGLVSFYFIILLYDSKGIYNWSKKLPVNEWTKTISELTYDHWRLISKMGFEEPKHSIETFWAKFQGMHPLLYPKKFRQIELDKKEHVRIVNERRELWKKDPEERDRYIRSRSISEVTIKSSREHKTLIVGDSLMMTVGPVLKESIERKWGSKVTLRAKLATGLARPDVFDWRHEIEELATSGKFNLTIIMIGTNDSQDFIENNQLLIYGTTPWVRAYRRRIEDIMSEICEYSENAIWIGLPPMQSKSFQRKSARLNHWILRGAEKNSCVKYIDSSTFLGDDAGQYASYKIVEGRSEKIRMPDGIHITKAGAQLLIDPVLHAHERVSTDKYAH
jgi:hypothetical protein